MIGEGDSNILLLPEGISGGDFTVTDIDCSVGWTIWYKTAAEALRARLTLDQIQSASLPLKTKEHLIKTETEELLERVKEVIDVYDF